MPIGSESAGDSTHTERNEQRSAHESEKPSKTVRSSTEAGADAAPDSALSPGRLAHSESVEADDPGNNSDTVGIGLTAMPDAGAGAGGSNAFEPGSERSRSAAQSVGIEATAIGQESDTASTSRSASTPPKHPHAERPPLGRIGLYELHGMIGEGGMGRVYRAYHPIDRRFVALKVVRPGLENRRAFEDLKRLFLREATVLKAVQHPNVVCCYEVNEAVWEGQPCLYMAMELLEGEPLSRRLAAGPLPLKDALVIAREVAKALHALHTHERRILHRDLKPHNIFLCKDGAVKVLDFGLAALADWRMTRLSTYNAGSRPYMSPEQFEGLKYCTERSDLYSLGVTLFEMVAGRPPFQCDSDLEYWRQHREHSPPPLTELVPATTAPDAETQQRLSSCENLVVRLLAKRPEERYRTAAEVVEAIDRILGGETISRPSVTRPERVRLRRRLAVAASIALVIAAVAFGAMHWQRSRLPRRIGAAREALNRGDLEDAARRIETALAIAPNEPRALKLAAQIEALLAARDALRHVAEDAEKTLAAIDDKPDPIAIVQLQARLRRALDQAEPLRRYRAATPLIKTLHQLAARVEQKRRQQFSDAIIRAGQAVGAGRFPAAAAALVTARTLAHAAKEHERLKEFMRRLERAQRLAEQQNRVEQARRAVERIELAQAEEQLDALRGQALSPTLSAQVRRLESRLHALKRAQWLSARIQEAIEQEHWPEAAKKSNELIAIAEALPGADLEAVTGKSAAWWRRRHGRAVFEERYARARALSDRGAFEEALEACRQAMMMAGAVPDARRQECLEFERATRRLLARRHLEKARALARESSLDEAVEQTRKALSTLAPLGCAELFSEYAQRSHGGEERRAREDLRKALRTPEHETAHEAFLLLEQLETERRCPSGFVPIPRTEGIVLGTDAPAARNRPHPVSLPPYYIGRTEVTNAEFEEFVQAGGYDRRALFDAEGWAARKRWAENSGQRVLAPPGWVDGHPPAGREREPVRGLCFAEARAYARWRGARLPTADEWEIAASLGPDGRIRRFPWGDRFVAAYVGAVRDEPGPVGSHPHDRSAFGVLDLGDSVQEWCVDPRPLNPEGRPVLKGGSYRLADRPAYFETWLRSYPLPQRYEDAGMRLALDPPPVPVPLESDDRERGQGPPDGKTAPVYGK